MDHESSSSDYDIIDDTGCEDKFQIENDTDQDEEGENEETMEGEPQARPLSRIQYSTFNTRGEEVKEDYYLYGDEYEYEEYDSSDDQCSEDDSGDELAPVEIDPKLRKKMDELGFGKMEDDFYDPTMDDRDAMWANKHYYDNTNDESQVQGDKQQQQQQPKHPKTDAILCCPNCFTMLCNECRLVRKGPLAKVNKTYDKEDSDVFVAKKVFHCLTVKTQSVKGTIQEGDNAKEVNMGYIVMCKTCANEVGFWNGKEYLLMNLIEENGELN